MSSAFPGDDLEAGGIRLSGAVGFEMRQLHQAVQSYQMVLDRFFSLQPSIATNLVATPANRFTTPAMVTTYLPRVLRASVQKSRAWAEAGRRYASLNRPALARTVIGRAYTAATIESFLIRGVFERVVGTAQAADRAQLEAEGAKAVVVYRQALVDLKKSFDDVRDGANSFGFAPEYVPFPALAPTDTNAFVSLLATTQQGVGAARAAEDQALSQTRTYDVDAAQFQSQLVTLRNSYENQLAQLCGTFSAPEAGGGTRVYPAIRRYAGASDRTRAFGDPCGLTGTGQIFDATAQVELASLDLRRVRVEFANLVAAVETETARAMRQCSRITTLADFVFSRGNQTISLEARMASARSQIAGADRMLQVVSNMASMLKCNVGLTTDCVGAAIGGMMVHVASIGREQVTREAEFAIAAAQAQVGRLQNEVRREELLTQCDSVNIDSGATIANHLLGFATLELDAMKAVYEAQRRIGAIASLRDQATRLEAEQEESMSLAVDLEAARNDPNVRIYKNDSVLTAERTFDQALKEAYKLTRVFEYYTSQSYGNRDALTLVRMVGHGDYTLEGYVRDLQSAYQQFSESNGRPDQRVDILSLRDDVLAIPLLDLRGVALALSDRVRTFREQLRDPARYDGRGYLVLPFATSFNRLSPLTRNHKVLYVEAEVVGANVGDGLGRVYLSQFGTGAVRPLAGVTNYYRFPERTAVINPFFNGRREFTADIYRNDRLRDRPLVNSNWEVVLNQRDERVNQDIDINALSDIKLYVYYTDFTAY